MHDTASGGALDNLDNVESLTAHFMHMFQENIERDGELHPVVIVVATKDPQTGEKFPSPTPALMPLLMSDEREKDYMASLIRMLAAKSEATAVLFATEAWVLMADVDGTSLDDHIKEAYRHGSISKHPKRKEVVLVSLEHHDLNHNGRTWMADILRTGSGKDEKVSLAEFKEMPKGTGVQGRFTHLLRPVEDEPS